MKDACAKLMIFITPNTINRPAEDDEEDRGASDNVEGERDHAGEPDLAGAEEGSTLLPAAGLRRQDFRFGHCGHGSTLGKLLMTFTEPSACTWPRYMVNGA